MDLKYFYFEIIKGHKAHYIGRVLTTKEDALRLVMNEMPERRCTIEENGLVTIY
jgi:hypothetical protein